MNYMLLSLYLIKTTLMKHTASTSLSHPQRVVQRYQQSKRALDLKNTLHANANKPFWPWLLSHLLRYGSYTVYQLAQQLEIPPDVLIDLHMGLLKDPSFSTGSKLLTLHAKVCPNFYSRSK